MAKKRKRKTIIQELERFWPLFLLLGFYLLFLLFWNNLSWIASPNVWQGYLSDAFPSVFPRPYVLVKKDPSLISGTPKIDNQLQIKSAANDATNPQQSDRPRKDILTIPRINITAPIITAATDDSKVITGLLDSGVVIYPGSVPFGQTGQTVILGHSAPEGWPKIKYEWVFSKLNDLEEGDMVVVTYNFETRYYEVAGKSVVMPQSGVPKATVEGNSLMLVSCWPPGKDLKRIAVEAQIMR